MYISQTQLPFSLSYLPSIHMSHSPSPHRSHLKMAIFNFVQNTEAKRKHLPWSPSPHVSSYKYFLPIAINRFSVLYLSPISPLTYPVPSSVSHRHCFNNISYHPILPSHSVSLVSVSIFFTLTCLCKLDFFPSNISIVLFLLLKKYILLTLLPTDSNSFLSYPL